MANYDHIDLDFTWDGDFYVGKDGDLADNRDDLIRSLENEIHTILRSEFGDWEKHPALGANLSDFRGEANTRQTGKRIEERVQSRLTAHQIVKDEDLTVRIVPVHRNKVIVILTISAASSPGNRLEAGDPIVSHVIYDSLEDSVFFLPPNDLEDGKIL